MIKKLITTVYVVLLLLLAISFYIENQLEIPVDLLISSQTLSIGGIAISAFILGLLLAVSILFTELKLKDRKLKSLQKKLAKQPNNA